MQKQLIALAATAALVQFGAAPPAAADVVISQIYGGNGNIYASDYVELYNNGQTAVAISGWSIQYASASGSGHFAANTPTVLSGTLQPGRWHLAKLATSLTGTALPAADTTGTTNLSASAGKVALVNTATGLACNGGSASCTDTQQAQIVDLVGYGSANFHEGSTAAPAPTGTTALLRKGSGCTDSNDNGADFTTASPAPRNSATTAVVCSGNGSGTPVQAHRIHEIQGDGDTSVLAGRTVSTSGVVTRLTNNGFFLQDFHGDSNPATSEGLFVFTNSLPSGVDVGQLVQLSGTVTEFAAGRGTVTQLTGPSAITVMGSGYTIMPTPVSLPVAGGLERFEGMLVTLAGPLTVNQNYFQTRYGQLTLSAGDRLETPTNRVRPGPQAQALAADNAARRVVLDDGRSTQNPNPTPFTGPNGALRGGDTIASITGVIDYGLSSAATGVDAPSDYRILPLDNASLSYTTTHPRTPAPPNVGGNVKVASFNVLNYFTTFTNGATANGESGQGCSLGGVVSAANCRGASSLVEFQRQRAKIVEALAAIDADVVGLIEIQNNGSVAVQNLVDALNARVGRGLWAVVPDPATGTGTDAIKVAMIYKPSRLHRVGAPTSDAAAINNRPPLAQTFAMANSERFTVVVNHLKSKGSCPTANDADYAGNFDTGDGQGCWNALRVQQTSQLRSFVAQRQAASGSDDVVLIGDFNAYAHEDPIHQLTSSGFVDQIGRFHRFGYSYVFDGAAGRLDHAITSASMSAKVTGTAHWHINADESPAHDYNLEFKQPACGTRASDPYGPTPYRSSDHDPVVMGLNLAASPRHSR